MFGSELLSTSLLSVTHTAIMSEVSRHVVYSPLPQTFATLDSEKNGTGDTQWNSPFVVVSKMVVGRGPSHYEAASAKLVCVWSFRWGLSVSETFSICKGSSIEQFIYDLTTSMCQHPESVSLSLLLQVKEESWKVHHILSNKTSFKTLHLNKYLEGEADSLCFPKMPLVCMRILLRMSHLALWAEKQYCLLQEQGRESTSHKFWVFTLPQTLGKHEETGWWGWLVISNGDNCHVASPDGY